MASSGHWLDALEELWRENGCVPLPTSDHVVPDPLAEVATVFALLTREEARFCGTSSMRRPGRSRGHWQATGNSSREPCYQVLLHPGSLNAQESVSRSLSTLQLDLASHDLALVASEWSARALRIESIGWTIRMNGLDVGRIGYLRRLAGIALDPLPLELRLYLEPLARLAGEGDSGNLHLGLLGSNYVRWRSLEERQSREYEGGFVAIPKLVREAEDCWAEAKSCIEASLPIPAWRLLTRSQLAVALMAERFALSEQETELWSTRLGEAAEQCARLLTEAST